MDIDAQRESVETLRKKLADAEAALEAIPSEALDHDFCHRIVEVIMETQVSMIVKLMIAHEKPE